MAALVNATDAGASVYSPYDWPTAPTAYPWVLVDWRTESKHSLGRNAPLFNVTTNIQIIARTKAPAQTGDAGSRVARAAAERLKQQIEQNIIGNPAVQANADGSQRIQQFKAVHTELNTSSEGEMPMAELVMTFEVEFVQAVDDFYPLLGTPLQGIDVTVQQPPGTVEPEFSVNFPS
ncbi:ABC transporter permease [Paraburkholderia sp. BR14320]|uniref:ABC transporter permease n=1 Tax=unclassified Paraburkholderia TaxID=2615204 RepID=UPI0034CD3DD1